MHFAWDTQQYIGNFIATLICIVLVFGALFFVLVKVAKRKSSFIFLGSCAFLFLLAYLFDLPVVCSLVAAVTAAGLAMNFLKSPRLAKKQAAKPAAVTAATKEHTTGKSNK